ncbi:protein PAXX [Anolis carolinensis]|uniref:PAXX non-homologous end joining factor n=1 Tax=Anolis carolinensis TaxID=28377 RepID=A0A803TDB6_ANOCA|nr:PREDICTED: protein PAXX [Anolis carolinensis]|eukprot:XP_008121595.1 PREDICTED: protein PAXX [Anolis carolinensis]
MALQGRLQVLDAEEGRGRCLLFLEGKPRSRILVTDAHDFWSLGAVASEAKEDSLKGGSGSSDISRLREALALGRSPSVTLGDPTATLRLPGVTLDLEKAPPAEARKELQGLMFALAEKVQALEQRLQEVLAASPVSSPGKSSSRSIFAAADLSPAKPAAGSGQPLARKRLPGESLINPGFKRKKDPTGVDFEDP